MSPPLENEQKEKIEELRHLLREELNADMYEDTDMFIRFLKARNYDVKASESMLRNHIKWRKTNKIDSFLSWYSAKEIAKTYISFNSLGFTKDGYPVVYIDFGHMDVRGCLKAMPFEEISHYFLQRLETDVKSCRTQTEKLKRKIDQWVYICNFDDYPLSQAVSKPGLEAVMKIVGLYEANYPERLKAAVLLNASWYFQLAFAVIKPVLSGATVQKIKIFGKSGWHEELLDMMHVEDLPAFLGGKRCDPDGDPMCRTFVNHGGLVPEKLFLSNNKSNFRIQPGVKKTMLHPLCKVRETFIVTCPGSYIEWEFETKERDIAFCLLYQKPGDHDSEMIKVVPKQRVNSSVSPEMGLYHCESIGTYYFEFDNSYSWVHQKEVYYKIQVIKPSLEKADD